MPMATELEKLAIQFPEGYDDRLEFETPSKGYLSDVVVRLPDGSEYKLFFIDPTRLQQDLEADIESGRNYYAEPGMVLLPRVTTDAIHQAVSCLWRDGFFRSLKPLAG
jgi:hypothetical protein